jgi:hypothetical protein
MVLGALATTLGSGWRRPDTHLVLPNGLPTRVVPTYPEPGLLTFTYPQQNVIDARHDAAPLAVGGPCSAGSDPCNRLFGPAWTKRWLGTWVPGDQVEGNLNLAPGTAIATFGSDGTYTNTHGQSHAAIYLGQDQTGIYVEDQWLGHAASTRVIPWTTSNPAARIQRTPAG